MGLKDEIINFTKDFISGGVGENSNYRIDLVWNHQTKSEMIEIIDNQTIKVTCLTNNPDSDFNEVDGKFQKQQYGKFEMIVKVFGQVSFKTIKSINSNEFKSQTYFFSKYSESLNTFLNDKKFSDKQLKQKCIAILKEFEGVKI